jgi:hypothetical protein
LGREIGIFICSLLLTFQNLLQHRSQIRFRGIAIEVAQLRHLPNVTAVYAVEGEAFIPNFFSEPCIAPNKTFTLLLVEKSPMCWTLAMSRLPTCARTILSGGWAKFTLNAKRNAIICGQTHFGLRENVDDESSNLSDS